MEQSLKKGKGKLTEKHHSAISNIPGKFKNFI